MFFSVHAHTQNLPAGSPIVNEECTQFIETIKSEYEYKWISTPLNYDEPDALKIKIFYYYKKGSLLKNPIIFFNGGPNSSSHGYHKLFNEKIEKFEIEKDIDFIYMDQRGTGCSSYSPFVGVSPESLNYYKWGTSLGIVEDSELIRKELIGKNAKWKIFGQSFGAYIVYRYIEKHPEAILKAYAHGYALGNSDFEGSYYRILSQHKIMLEFFKRYPQMQAKLNLIFEKLSDPDLCFSQPNSVKVCGFELLTPMIYMLGFTNKWINLINIISSLVPEDEFIESEVQKKINQYDLYGFLTLNNSLKQATQFDQQNLLLNYAGFYDWNTTPFDNEKCLNIYKELQEKNNLKSDQLIFNECLPYLQYKSVDLTKTIFKTVPEMPPSQFVELTNIQKNILKFKLSVHVYSGSLDLFIPKKYFDYQNKILGDLILYKNFPNSGHDGFFSERDIYLDL